MKSNRCAKLTTLAVIETVDNELFWGHNECLKPQKSCPRESQGCKTGEGYELCKEVCEQTGHAEVNACVSAGAKAKGGTLTLFGHTYCCKNCLNVMKQAGIKTVHISDTGATLII